jgi:hypothetical protein
MDEVYAEVMTIYLQTRSSTEKLGLGAALGSVLQTALMVGMKRYFSIAWCLVALTAGAADEPKIAVITEPACNGEPIIVTGEGFIPGKTVVKAICLGAFDAKNPDDPLRHLDALGHPPELPARPPGKALDCKILGSGDGFLQVEFRCVTQPWVHAPLASAVWVGDGTNWSVPYLVNRPQA